MNNPQPEGDTQQNFFGQRRSNFSKAAPLLLLLLLGFNWWREQREHRVQLFLNETGCAAMKEVGVEQADLPSGGAACTVRAVLLPSPLFENLQSPDNSMYRLRPIGNSKAEEIWLKRNLVVAVIYEQ